MNDTKQKFKLLLAMTIFGTIGIFVKFIAFPSGTIAFFRGIIGVLFLLLIMAIRKQKPDFKAIKKNLLPLILSGAFIGINWILLFEAYRHTTVSTATLCYYMSPIFVIIASPFILKEKISVKKVICVLTALFGMVLVSEIFTEENTSQNNFTGILLGLGAALFYAAVVLTNKKIKDISDYDMTVCQLFTAAITIFPYTLIVEKQTENADLLSVILLLAVGIIHTGLAYSLYFGAVNKLKAQTAAVFGYVDPAVSIILSIIILGDDFSLPKIFGAILILGAAAVSEINFNKNKNA